MKNKYYNNEQFVDKTQKKEYSKEYIHLMINTRNTIIIGLLLGSLMGMFTPIVGKFVNTIKFNNPALNDAVWPFLFVLMILGIIYVVKSLFDANKEDIEIIK